MGHQANMAGWSTERFPFINGGRASCSPASLGSCSFIEDAAPEDSDADSDTELEEVVRSEREYVRERLREELGREPEDEEVDEWLRQHTEGY